MATSTPISQAWQTVFQAPGCYLEPLRRLPDAGAADRDAFIAYMKSCQLETTFYFAAVNDKSVPATLRALQIQTAVADFIAAHQGDDPVTLQRDFIHFAAQLKTLPRRRLDRWAASDNQDRWSQ